MGITECVNSDKKLTVCTYFGAEGTEGSFQT